MATGSFQGVAQAKLMRAGIPLSYFSFGSYGGEGDDKVSPMHLAIDRARVLYGDAMFVVVGDAPADIDAAFRLGVSSIGVASGRYSKEDLEKAHASVVVERLNEAGLILGFARP